MLQTRPFAARVLPVVLAAAFSFSTVQALGYYPPSEASGGWRKNTDSAFVTSLGMDPTKLGDFGQYNLSISSSSGVKGCIVIKNGWIVGEWYNNSDAETYLNYISSNGKAWAMLLFGIVVEDGEKGALPYAVNLASKVYDSRWLAEGFPLSDARKSQITFHQIFKHTSGILPESVGDTRSGADWDFQLYTVGRDPDYPESATLYFDPGTAYDYSSVAFNHMSLFFRNITGVKASQFLKARILDPIGFGTVSYKHPTGMGDYDWAPSGQTGPQMTTRDYARLAYLMLRQGNWDGQQLFGASWLDTFATSADYPNIRSNVDGNFGSQYPSDMFRVAGSGLNWAFMVPSLDLIALRTSRASNSLWDEVQTNFLQKLFDAVSTGNTAPSASIGSPADGASFTAGDRMDYSGSATDPEDGTLSGGALAWEVDIVGDGLGPVHTSSGASGSYTFPSDITAATTYRLRLTATDSGGLTSTAEIDVYVQPQPTNGPPSASISSPADGASFTAGDTMDYSGSATDPEDGTLSGGALAWELDILGDGLGPVHTSTGASGSYTFPSDITASTACRLRLTATDSGGLSHTAEVTVYVDPQTTNRPPSVSLSASPTSGEVPLVVSFDAGSSDPDGDALTHEWDWDYDGADFAAEETTGTTSTATHSYGAAGDYTAAVRVSDGLGLSRMATVSITVSQPSSTQIVIECEDMTLADYLAEGDGYIAVDYNAGRSTGTATASFPGATGRYRVEVVIVKEDDGQPTLDVYVAGALVGTIDYQLGAAKRDPETVDLGELEITSGAEIQLVGTMDAGAAARVDKIIFTPVGSSSDSDGDDLPDSWEQQYFGNLDQGTDDDFDGDGASNYTEYTQGTDPTDDTDFPPPSSTDGGAGFCSPTGPSGPEAAALALAFLAVAALALGVVYRGHLAWRDHPRE